MSEQVGATEVAAGAADDDVEGAQARSMTITREL
jgi:hypothetical protein